MAKESRTRITQPTGLYDNLQRGSGRGQFNFYLAPTDTSTWTYRVCESLDNRWAAFLNINRDIKEMPLSITFANLFVSYRMNVWPGLATGQGNRVSEPVQVR